MLAGLAGRGSRLAVLGRAWLGLAVLGRAGVLRLLWLGWREAVSAGAVRRRRGGRRSAGSGAVGLREAVAAGGRAVLAVLAGRGSRLAVLGRAWLGLAVLGRAWLGLAVLGRAGVLRLLWLGWREAVSAGAVRRHRGGRRSAGSGAVGLREAVAAGGRAVLAAGRAGVPAAAAGRRWWGCWSGSCTGTARRRGPEPRGASRTAGSARPVPAAARPPARRGSRSRAVGPGAGEGHPSAGCPSEDRPSAGRAAPAGSRAAGSRSRPVRAEGAPAHPGRRAHRTVRPCADRRPRTSHRPPTGGRSGKSASSCLPLRTAVLSLRPLDPDRVAGPRPPGRLVRRRRPSP